MARPIETDHYVKSADRVIYRVTYVHEGTGEADLIAVDGGGRATLPLAELRRIANPREKRPAIEGLPADRPRCAWCDRPLRPMVDVIFSDEAPLKRTIVRRVFVRWRTVADAFDTNGCAIRFAKASYRGGYRKTKGRGRAGE